MALTPKHQEVIEQYFLCWNKTEAYHRVFPTVKRSSAAANAYRLFEMPEMQDAISQRLNESAMSSEEVLNRVAAHARGDIDDYLDTDGKFDLKKAREAKKTGNIKKLKTKTTTRTYGDETIETVEVEFELYDALAAKALLGKHHRLFVDRAEVTGANGGPIEQKSTVAHGIDGSAAQNIFDVLAAAGVFAAAFDDAKDNQVHTI